MSKITNDGLTRSDTGCLMASVGVKGLTPYCFMLAMCVMCWFIIHKTLQSLYLLCYYFVLVALFVVYICTWTLLSFYARLYVFTFYV